MIHGIQGHLVGGVPNPQRLTSRVVGQRVSADVGVLSDLLEGTFVADSAAQTSLVGGVEPDRDQHRAARRRRLHKVRILERSGDASVLDRLESISVSCTLGGSVRFFPAANLGMEFLTVFTPDPIVHRPAIL
jgi:hypothetical protein